MRTIEVEQLDFTTLIRPGDTVTWTSGVAEPLSLSERLVAQRHAIGGFKLLLGTLYSNTIGPEHCDVIRPFSFAATGTARHLTKAGKLDILPIHNSEFANLVGSGHLPIDVALVQLAEHPETGELSYGAVNGYVPEVMQTARFIIAEINTCAPFTRSRVPVPRDRINLVVRSSRPLLDFGDRRVTPGEETIGRHIAELVPDGGVLQVGVGSIPQAVLSALGNHRDLGLFSGTIGDAVVPLIEAGVINNSRKTVDAGLSITGTLIGTKKLYEFAHLNDSLRVEPISHTSDFNALQACDRLISINSGVEVDLTGQINAEIAGGLYLGALGGQAEFMRAAKYSAGGAAILALPSITPKGQSRIVPRLVAGVVTTPRSDVDYVVTEYGVAYLRGATLSERLQRLIKIAHPDHRETLERESRNIPGATY